MFHEGNNKQENVHLQIFHPCRKTLTTRRMLQCWLI